MGWQEAPPVDAGSQPSWMSAPPVDEKPRTDKPVDDQLKRQGGLTIRHLIEGVAGLPNMVGDAVNTAINYGTRGINSVAGTDIPRLGMPSQVTSEALTSAGLPEPATDLERVVGGASKAVAGAGSAIKTAATAPAKIAAMLQARPGMQAAAGATGGAASATAANMGADPWAQLAIGMLTGVMTPAAATLAQSTAEAATRAAGQLAKPFTQAGREQVVGSTLNRLAADKSQALSNMGDVAEIVPGSQATTAQASRDPGLLQVERALSATDPKFAARKSANNAARNQVLDDIAGSPEDLQAAKDSRSAQANDLYEKAFTQPLNPDTPIQPLLDLAKRPAFQSAVRKAADLAAENGEPVQDIMTSPKGLHYIKLAMDDMLDTAAQSGIGKTQQRAIAQTRQQLVDFLDQASPAYAQARAGFREASGPVNQREAGQEIQTRTRLAGPDVTGEPIISQAKWQNVVTNKLDELGKKLSPDHIKRLQEIGADLDRASLSDTAGRAVGSNTFQNLSTANLLGAALGNKLANNAVAQTITRPLQWLYKVPEEQVKDLLTQAMLDPSIARAMMAKASRQNVDFLGAALRDKARAMGLGATTGSASQ